MKLFYLLVLFSSMAATIAVNAADAVQPAFNNRNALMQLGQDDQIYLASGDHVLHCNRDGSNPVLGKVAPMLTGATANSHGLMAMAHAHFAKNVTLCDSDFNVVERFTRIGDYNFTAPAGVEAGPSGDFYALDQGRDQVIRFHPDGIKAAIYKIPHQQFDDKRYGYLIRFRVCEQTHSLYVVNWQTVRCFNIDSREYSFEPRLKWELKDTSTAMNLAYGYGGMSIDEKGTFYTIAPLNEEFVTSYDADGKVLKKYALQVGTRKFVDPTRVLGLVVSKGEVFIKRQDDTEMFLRFKLDTGELTASPILPADLNAISRSPGDANAGQNVAPVKSAMGIPAHRKVLRVLFVGNSQVNAVRDIPDMVEEISRTNPNTKAPIVVSDEVVIGGVGLEGLWQDGLPRKRIAAGGWDYVVINDLVYSFGFNKDKFNTYAALFDAAIKNAGARTLFFATADVDKRREQHPLMYANALEFARAHGDRVAGAGMAWLKAWEKDPALDLHFTDRAHPNPLGYYFNACVIYSALTDASAANPAVSTCDAATPEQAAMVQELAWRQYAEDRANEKTTPASK